MGVNGPGGHCVASICSQAACLAADGVFGCQPGGERGLMAICMATDRLVCHNNRSMACCYRVILSMSVGELMHEGFRVYVYVLLDSGSCISI